MKRKDLSGGGDMNATFSPLHGLSKRQAPMVQITGPEPLAGEQVTGVPVRCYDLNPVTLGPGLHGLRWRPHGLPPIHGDWEFAEYGRAGWAPERQAVTSPSAH